jgi:hypothetical protein
MPRLLKRWYVWLGLVLLLGLAGSVALILANPSRITQANFDRIQQGMSLEEVEEVLGKDETQGYAIRGEVYCWGHGPSEIIVWFRNGRAEHKHPLHLATIRETLQWYAKKGAEKIGVKWD